VIWAGIVAHSATLATQINRWHDSRPETGDDRATGRSGHPFQEPTDVTAR
jgi:hypothetical protein